MERILNKAGSGRFLLTASVALLILYTGITRPDSFADMKEIVLVVIYAYFNRQPEKETKP
jgi:hypothetical protein